MTVSPGSLGFETRHGFVSCLSGQTGNWFRTKEDQTGFFEESLTQFFGALKLLLCEQTSSSICVFFFFFNIMSRFCKKMFNIFEVAFILLCFNFAQ